MESGSNRKDEKVDEMIEKYGTLPLKKLNRDIEMCIRLFEKIQIDTNELLNLKQEVEFKSKADRNLLEKLKTKFNTILASSIKKICDDNKLDTLSQSEFFFSPDEQMEFIKLIHSCRAVTVNTIRNYPNELLTVQKDCESHVNEMKNLYMLLPEADDWDHQMLNRNEDLKNKIDTCQKDFVKAKYHLDNEIKVEIRETPVNASVSQIIETNRKLLNAYTSAMEKYLSYIWDPKLVTDKFNEFKHFVKIKPSGNSYDVMVFEDKIEEYIRSVSTQEIFNQINITLQRLATGISSDSEDYLIKALKNEGFEIKPAPKEEVPWHKRAHKKIQSDLTQEQSKRPSDFLLEEEFDRSLAKREAREKYQKDVCIDIGALYSCYEKLTDNFVELKESAQSCKERASNLAQSNLEKEVLRKLQFIIMENDPFWMKQLGGDAKKTLAKGTDILTTHLGIGKSIFDTLKVPGTVGDMKKIFSKSMKVPEAIVEILRIGSIPIQKEDIQGSPSDKESKDRKKPTTDFYQILDSAHSSVAHDEDSFSYDMTMLTNLNYDLDKFISDNSKDLNIYPYRTLNL